MLRECYAHFVNRCPGVAGFEDRESLFAHLENKKIAAEVFPVRHTLAIEQAVETHDLGSVSWFPGLENPADGLTETKSYVAPLPRLVESGTYNPGILRPLKGGASCGN